jgi:hypothetical protein
MVDTSLLNALRRALPVAMVGLGVFAATLTLLLCDPSIAASYPSAMVGEAVSGVPGPADQGVFFLLAATFAGIVMLDMAFVRHVMRAYAVPNRRVGRHRVRKIAHLNRDTEL